MKFTFITHKNLFCKLLLLLLAALLLVSCNHTEKDPKDTAEQSEETTEQVEVIKPNPKHTVEPIHRDLLMELTNSEPCDEYYKPTYYYGTYNGCVVTSWEGQLAVNHIIEVAGYTFDFGARSYISVWKDGEEIDLQEAYDQGLLTKDQIRILSEIHKERSFIEYYIQSVTPKAD